jgi:hypothetical protein
MQALDELFSNQKQAKDKLPRVSTLLRMISLGLFPNDEHFVSDCRHAIRTHHQQNLRKKARIHVRDDGAVLMGGIETVFGTRGYIFCQCRKKEFQINYQFEPLLGAVVVTKRPAMHPRDVRRLIALDIPQKCTRWGSFDGWNRRNRLSTRGYIFVNVGKRSSLSSIGQMNINSSHSLGL